MQLRIRIWYNELVARANYRAMAENRKEKIKWSRIMFQPHVPRHVFFIYNNKLILFIAIAINNYLYIQSIIVQHQI